MTGLPNKQHTHKKDPDKMMDLTGPAAPEVMHREPVVKHEFAPSSSPWNQFAPGALVIDDSEDDDQSETVSLDNDETEASASFAISERESAPEANLNTTDTTSSMISYAPHLAMMQDLARFSEAVNSRLEVVKSAPTNGRVDPEDGVPSILHQLPSLDPFQASDIWKDSATPVLLPEGHYFIRYWRTAFFAGIFVYVNEAEVKCLQALAPDKPYQLTKPWMLDLSSVVARRDPDHVKIISSKDGDFEEMEGDIRPSFNTLGLRAFPFYIRPHLNIIERRELQTFWASLPPFDPLKPNHDPARPSEPAAPRQIGPALWDWSDMLQPARWFICSCALADHQCGFTGEAPVNCCGWHDVCTEQVE